MATTAPAAAAAAMFEQQQQPILPPPPSLKASPSAEMKETAAATVVSPRRRSSVNPIFSISRLSEFYPFTTHDSRLDFSARFLACAHANGSVTIWSVTQQQQPFQVINEAHDGPVMRVAWAPVQFGTLLITGGGDATVKVWKLSEYQEWLLLYSDDQTHTSVISCIEVASLNDNLYIFVGSYDGFVSVHTMDHQSSWSKKKFRGNVCGVTALSPADKNSTETAVVPSTMSPSRVAVGGLDGNISIWSQNEHSGEWFCLGTVTETPMGIITDLSWRPLIFSSAESNVTLAACSADGFVSLWAPAEDYEWKEVKRFDLEKQVWNISWTLNGNLLMVYCAYDTEDEPSSCVCAIVEDGREVSGWKLEESVTISNESSSLTDLKPTLHAHAGDGDMNRRVYQGGEGVSEQLPHTGGDMRVNQGGRVQQPRGDMRMNQGDMSQGQQSRGISQQYAAAGGGQGRQQQEDPRGDMRMNPGQQFRGDMRMDQGVPPGGDMRFYQSGVADMGSSYTAPVGNIKSHATTSLAGDIRARGGAPGDMVPPPAPPAGGLHYQGAHPPLPSGGFSGGIRPYQDSSIRPSHEEMRYSSVGAPPQMSAAVPGPAAAMPKTGGAPPPGQGPILAPPPGQGPMLACPPPPPAMVMSGVNRGPPPPPMGGAPPPPSSYFVPPPSQISSNSSAEYFPDANRPKGMDKGNITAGASSGWFSNEPSQVSTWQQQPAGPPNNHYQPPPLLAHRY